MRSKSGAWWLGAALIFSSAYAAVASDLTVISFGRADRAALVKAYVDPFAKSTGINMHSLSYDGQVTELTQMVRAGAPIWDVMQVESRTLVQGCRLGLFEKTRRRAPGAAEGPDSRRCLRMRRRNLRVVAGADFFGQIAGIAALLGGLLEYE